MNRWGFVALVLFLVDQVSKFLAVHNGFFSLHKNYGIAFDLPVPSWIVIPLTLGIIIAATFALWHHRLNLNSPPRLFLSFLVGSVILLIVSSTVLLLTTSFYLAEARLICLI